MFEEGGILRAFARLITSSTGFFGRLADFVSKRPCWAIFVITLAVRAVYLIQCSTTNPFFQSPINDALFYDQRAQDVLKNGLLGGDRGAYWQAPGYHYFLALIYSLLGHNYVVVYAAQALMGAANCVMIARLGELLFGRRAAVAAGLIAAFYGVFVFFDGELLPATLTLFLNLALLLSAIKAARARTVKAWIMPGLLLGFSVITRSDAVLIAPAALFFMWLEYGRTGATRRSLLFIKHGGAFLAAVLLVVLPVTARNYAVAKDRVLVSWNGGINFYIGNGPRFPASIDTALGKDWMMLVTEPQREAGAKKRSDHSAYFFRKGVKFVVEHPAVFLRNVVIKFFHAFNGPEIWRNTNLYFHRDWSPLFAVLVWRWKGVGFPFGVVGPLGLLGMILAWRRRGELALLYGYAAAYLAALLIFFVTERYRAPLVPVLILFSASALTELYGRARASGVRSVRNPACLGAVLLVVFNLGLFHFEGGHPLQNYFYIGRAHMNKGRFDEAIRNFDEAKRMPDYARPYVFAARAYERKGELKEAIWEIESALQVDPGDYEALETAGELYARSGNTRAARRMYERALKLPLGNKTALRRKLSRLAGGKQDGNREGGRGRPGAKRFSPRKEVNTKNELLTAPALRQQDQETALAGAEIGRHLTEENKKILMKAARAVMDERFRSGRKADLSGIVQGPLGSSKAVLVGILMDGVHVASGHASRGELVRTTAEAALRAADAALRRYSRDQLIGKTQIDIDFVVDEIHFPKWSPKTLKDNFVLGEHGIVLDVVDGRRILKGTLLKPSDTRVSSHEKLVELLLKKMAVSRSRLGALDTVVRRFSTVEILEDPRSASGYKDVADHRSGGTGERSRAAGASPPGVKESQDAASVFRPAYVDLQDVTPQSIEGSIRLAAEWISQNRNSKGFFMYRYLPLEDTIPRSNDLTRQAGTAAVMAILGKGLSVERYLSDSEACVRWILGNKFIRYVDSARTKAFILGPGKRDHLGQSALLLWALYELHDRRKQDETLMKKMADGILDMQRSDGSFSTQFLDRKSRLGESFYSGEAMLALLCFHKVSGDEKYLKAVWKSYHYYRRVWEKRPSLGFATLQAEAAAALYRTTRNADVASYVLEIGEWAAQKQYAEQKTPRKEFVGGTVSPREPARPQNSTLLEIVAEAAGIARETGAAEKYAFLREAALRAARFALNVQVGKEEASQWKSPERAVGAFQQTFDSKALQVDVTAHTLLGLTKALRYCYPVKQADE